MRRRAELSKHAAARRLRGILPAGLLLCLFLLPLLGAGEAAAQSRAQLWEVAPPEAAAGSIPDEDQPPTEQDAPEPLTPAEGTAPEAAPGPSLYELDAPEPRPEEFPGRPAEGRVIIEGAEEFRWERGASLLRGNVRLRTTQYELRADEAELDAEEEWVSLRGAIDLRGEFFAAQGQLMRVHRRTGEWLAEQKLRGRVEPEFFEAEQVVEPLYLRADRGAGPERDGPLEFWEGEMSSCDQERRHYFFSSDHVEVRPGRELIARRPVIYFFGNRLFQLPFDLVLWLDRRRNQFLPEVGQNDVEGFYAKFAFGYLLSQVAEGVVRLNLTQRRGAGLGIEQYLSSERARGIGSVMWEPGEGSLTSRLQLGYQLSSEWRGDLTGSYQTNSGYFGNTSSLTHSLLVSRRTVGGQLQLGYQRATTASSFSDSERTGLTLTQRQRWGRDGTWAMRANWEDFSYGTGFGRRQLNTDFEASSRAGSFDWTLLASKLFEFGLGEGVPRRFALNRLPALSVRTDHERLRRGPLLGGIPFQAEFMLGQFEQQPDGFSVLRGGMDLRLGGQRMQWGRSNEARLSGRLLQTAYGDGSAQYVLGADFDLRQDWGGNWQNRLRYNHQEQHGFAPLGLDFGGRQDSLYWQLVQARTDRSRLEFATGYDFVGDFWQDFLVRAEYMPSRHTKLSLQGAYSLERSEWRPFGLIWTQANLPAFWMNLATQYDLEGRGLTRASLELDWRLSREWQVGLVAGYSGWSKQVDTLDLGIYRDLHCLTASLIYSKERNEIMFNLGIKAFPGPRRVLGIGRGGQQFQALPGQYY